MAEGSRPLQSSRRVALVLLAALAAGLAGCAGGLFPEPVGTSIEPQACGPSGPRYAPYFRASPVRGAAPLAVTFSSDGPDVTEWHWSFGDGATSALPAPTHVYAIAGTYTVELAVTRPEAGGSGTATSSYKRTRYIHVSGDPDLKITALTHAPDVGTAGTTVAFTVTVANSGTAAAPPTYLRIAGTRSRTLVLMPRLTPGASATATGAVTMATAPESFTITADGTSRAHESDETDNTVVHVVSAIP